MVAEVMAALAVKPGGLYIDGTFGAGGHSRAILAAGGSVLAIDRDPLARDYARALSDEAGAEGRLRLAGGNFRDLRGHLMAARLGRADGILLDLGLSSMHVDHPERGFAFRQEGPLDMRMGGEGETAAEVVNTYDEAELASIIYRYGEERHSRRVARRIAEARAEKPIESTTELADIVRRAYPAGPRRDHPARRTFQALRIHVNDELGALEQALEQAEEVLAPGGRLVVIAYHSLEDRIVKRFLRASTRLEPLHKRPLTATDEEIARNPRARSAKLRSAQKSPTTPAEARP
ncbi:MAG: 16S rRNA (cytosine(1402)-N(4))-methyltransferase RsmH [Deinococcota bacterium]|nr:16S rRNA (cytosine(1402)-N(4))-methyltransferase RsmH [Deinococcota bacterium]